METRQFDIHMDSIANSKPNLNYHLLKTQWNLWSHLPHDTDWSINSYKNICKFTSVEETIAILEK